MARTENFEFAWGLRGAYRVDGLAHVDTFVFREDFIDGQCGHSTLVPQVNDVRRAEQL
jgi:hypothetical protein